MRGPVCLVALLTVSLATLVSCRASLVPVTSLRSNLSGYLVNRNGQYYVQPADPLHSSPEALDPEAEGSWSESPEYQTLTEEEEEEFKVDSHFDDDIDEDGPSWQKRQRSRGFSIFGAFESAFGVVSKLISNIISDDDDDTETNYQDSGVTYKDHQLLRITPKNKKQVKHLEELRASEPDDVKFWTAPTIDKKTDVVVSPGMLKDVKEFLREKKMNFVVLISDLERVIKLQNPRMPKERRQDLVSLNGHSMTWKRYHRYKDIMNFLDYLGERYPQLVEIQTIGNSFEGRALKIAKISTGANKDGEPKPSIWIDAGMHAREWISTAVATYIINQLVEKSDNYSRLLDLTDWVIMPIANPDGYEYTHTDDRLWRKTRSTHDTDSDDESRQAPGFLHMLSHYTKWLFGSCEGVDPNRNFQIHWGEDKIAGASNDPCHDTYAGPSPFSEPETRAIANYIMENKRTIRTYLTLHSYSQMLLVPWGFTRTRPADFHDLMNIATKAKQAIAKVHNTEYKVGPAAELLYPTTGSSDDWAKAVAGVKNAFTMELRDRGAYGFLLPASQILATARETWAGVRVIARMGAMGNRSIA